MSLQDGQYMWFYGASPEQQAAYMAQGQYPPDYPMTFPDGGQSGGGGIPDVITFGNGGNLPQGFGGRTGNPNAVAPGAAGVVQPRVSTTDMHPKDEPTDPRRGRLNPNQAPLPASDPQSFFGQTHPPTPESAATAALRQNGTLIANNAAATDILLAQLQQFARETQAKNDAEIARQNGLIDAQDPVDQFFGNYLLGQAGDLSRSRDTANKAASESLGNYRSGLLDLNSQNDAAIGRLGSVYDQLSTPLVANLQSQAAIADGEALAGQRQALGQLQGAAGGALDYTSQAAGAYADPKYLAMRDKGLEDLYGVSQGSKDVHVGQEDPEAYRAAMDALHQMGELTTPQLTDAERFLYEQARQAQEMDERGLSAARMSDLRRRGMAGGGAELTQNAIDSQRISQNRLLSDLAASAGAVSRATGMLQAYGNLGGQLNSEANALATGNANRQLQALGMYEQGSEVAQQQSFQQAYDRGLAADKASSDNQATRLNGMIASGNQANAMQDDAFNRGQAADVMARYNKTFEQDERNALWGRTTDLTGMTLSKNAQNSNNLTNLFQGEQSVANSNYIRDRDVVGTNVGIAGTIHGWGTDQLDRRIGVSGRAIGNNNTTLGQNANIVGAQIGANQFTLPLMMQNNTQIASIGLGEKERKEAERKEVAATRDANSDGILGTFIGSKNGLAGLFNGSWTNGSGGLTNAQVEDFRARGIEV